MDYTTIDEVKIHNELIKFRDFLMEKHTNLIFKPTDNESVRNNEWVNYFSVYSDHEPDFRIGSIGYSPSNKHWWIGGVYPKINVSWHYDAPDNIRKSIHMKNLNKFVKDLLVFPTMKVYASNSNIYAMNSYINSYRDGGNWIFSQQTHNLPDATFEDFRKLNEMGYQPISSEFRKIMTTIVEKSEELLERKKYNPEYYHVWVRKSGITYVKLDNNDFTVPEEKVVMSRAELPMPIQEKMAILDLMEIKHEVYEDIGAKEKPDFYTVFA